MDFGSGQLDKRLQINSTIAQQFVQFTAEAAGQTGLLSWAFFRILRELAQVSRRPVNVTQAVPGGSALPHGNNPRQNDSDLVGGFKAIGDNGVTAARRRLRRKLR